MNRSSQKLLWGGLLLAIVLGTTWRFFPLPDAGDVLDSLPKHGPGFASSEVPLTPQEDAHLGNAHVLRRIYQVARQRVILTIVDGSRNRHAVHDPLYCYRGAGWEVIGRRPMKIDDDTVELLKLKKQDRQREVLFWYSDGRSRYTSAPRYWWETTLRRLTFGRSGREPVLVVVEQFGTDSINWHRMLRQFTALRDV